MTKLDSKSNGKIYMSSLYGMNAMIKIQKSQGLSSQADDIPYIINGGRLFDGHLARFPHGAA